MDYKSHIARVEPLQLRKSSEKSLRSAQSYIFSNGRVSPHEHDLVHSPVMGSCLWPLAGNTWQWPSLATLDFPTEKKEDIKFTRVTFQRNIPVQPNSFHYKRRKITRVLVYPKLLSQYISVILRNKGETQPSLQNGCWRARGVLK